MDPVRFHSWIAGLVIGDVLMAELRFLGDVTVRLGTADGAALEVNITYLVFILVDSLVPKLRSLSSFLILSVLWSLNAFLKA